MISITFLPFFFIVIQQCGCVTTEEEEAKMLSEIENDLVALKTELDILKSYVKLGKFSN